VSRRVASDREKNVHLGQYVLSAAGIRRPGGETKEAKPFLGTNEHVTGKMVSAYQEMERKLGLV
jgi:hypothetical protein